MTGKQRYLPDKLDNFSGKGPVTGTNFETWPSRSKRTTQVSVLQMVNLSMVHVFLFGCLLSSSSNILIRRQKPIQA